MEECGITFEDTSVIIKRIISSNGKNKVLLNQQVSTVATLTKFAQYWLDVTSQHGQQKLTDPLAQIEMLDQAGDYQDVLAVYQQRYIQLRSKKQELQSLLTKKEKAQAEKDFLTFQWQELSKAQLQIGQLEELQNQYSRIKNGKEIADLVGNIYRQISGDHGVMPQISQTLRSVEKLAKLDTDFEPYITQISDISVTLQELASQAQQLRATMGMSESEADELNSRISFLQKIEKKYGSVEQAVAKRDEIKAKLDLVSEESDVQWQLEKTISAMEELLQKEAQTLTAKRKKNANTLSKAITAEVQYLGMQDAKIDIQCQDWDADTSGLTIGDKKYHLLGAEKIVFMFAPNVGEGSLELTAIASGGEISRVMLAIKSVAIQKSGSFDKTYLFDEVDTGVGGQTAERIGQRMHVLASQEAQVLNVTHLAQVAAYADRHAKVMKETKQGRTTTKIIFLTSEERKAELARMIGGIELTKKTFAFATELLEKKDKDALTPGQGRL
ncbi:MAG: hypothetical protein KDK51_01865 [Deltaproteobacteria bacterium]|nr:hypothetical protein [Deltaproteobacteria bacterium]